MFSCEYKGCTEKQVDLIKCNACNSWVYEKCSDLYINKLKPIFNSCKTLHFLCKSCEFKIDATFDDSNNHSEKSKKMVKGAKSARMKNGIGDLVISTTLLMRRRMNREPIHIGLARHSTTLSRIQPGGMI